MKTIDPDVASVARHFGLDPRLLQAVEKAEGNILKAVQCSLPRTRTRDEALQITARSAVHAMCDYIIAHDQEAFVKFWAQRWAPQGAENDPTDLNQHWPTNVLQLWRA